MQKNNIDQKPKLRPCCNAGWIVVKAQVVHHYLTISHADVFFEGTICQKALINTYQNFDTF